MARPEPVEAAERLVVKAGSGLAGVARPGGGEVEKGVDDRVVAVGVPDETGTDVWAVAERQRDPSRMCETVGHPGGQRADGPAGGNDLDAIFGGFDVIGGAGRGAATLLV